MSDQGNADEENDPPVCVFHANQLGACYEASLVLTARFIDNRIHAHPPGSGGGWGVYVALANAALAREELTAYVEENRPRPNPARQVVEFDSGWYGVFGFLLVIWGVPWMQENRFFAADPQMWLEQGRLQAGLVLDGQWWRTVTALTLHSDLGHLMSNSVFGAVFGLALGRYLGSGFGWLMVLLAAAIGNWANASVRWEEFRSIGASTANFALLGLMGTFVWRRGYLRGPDWRRSMAPVVAAIALLALLGVGDERTDVVAHFAGFVSGALFGLVIPQFNVRRLGRSGQILCGLLAFSLIVYAWQTALTITA